MEHKRNILIGCTGSVAAIKLPVVLNLMKKRNQSFQIRVVLTEKAKHFVNINEISAMGEIFTDQSEWQISKGLNEQSLHLDLVQWADVFIISPLDANTLGKISSGICDNLLTCIARSWDLHKPLLFCPEMNTRQFLHPITNRQIEEIKNFGYYELPSISETLVTEGNGHGALSEINYIIDAIFNHVQSVQSQQQQQHMTQTQGQTKTIYHQSLPSPLNDSIKKFVCNICNASFAKANYLNNHKRIHTGESSNERDKPYICGNCGQGFAQSTHLKNHERIHTGEKPFTCEICQKTFARYSTLWNHRRIHTGEKPYKCSWCQSAFSQATHLRKHEKVHLGIKPFKCELCNSSFSDRFALQRHQKTHLKVDGSL